MTKKKLLEKRAGSTDLTPPEMSGPVIRRAAVAAMLAAGAFSPSLVHALALGQAKVMSALGETLRVEVEVPQITAEEASSLKVGVPPPSSFTAAGVEYNPALARAAITLEHRPDGRAYLRVTSDRIVSEPFVDLILQLQWATGRVERNYTLLFDPPMTRPAAPPPVAAQLPSAPASPRPADGSSAKPLSALPQSPQAAARTPTAPPPPAVAARAPAPIRAPAPVAAPRPEPRQVEVKAGDTAGRIASANLRGDVSLDQMLVAMLRANPEAFIGNNVNRIKAGALIDLPSNEQASKVTAAEARKLVAVQSADFNEFRRKLADSSTATAGGTAGRQTAGQLQTSVEDRQAANASPDKLKLSKGGTVAKSAEARIAASRQKQDADQRVAELSRNLQELNTLQNASSAKAAAGTTPAASGPQGPGVPIGSASMAAKPASASAAVVANAASAANPAAMPLVSASKPASAMASAVSPSTAASEAVASTPAASAVSAKPAASAAMAAAATASLASASATEAPAAAAAASTPAVAAATPASRPASASKPKAPPPPPPPEPSFLDDLLDNPLIPAGLVGLIALLAGFGFYRLRQRKHSTQVDSSFLESKAQPDSFFGSSGGQHVDTNDETPTGSSLAYSPSQLDAAGDVDPVAEADVYLAYGRDLQAEEILREAMRVNPSRIAIHSKLMEIYAKRRDVRAFEVVAEQALKLTGGDGPEWERVCAMGRDLDGDNALYQVGGRPTSSTDDSAAEKTTAMLATATQPVPITDSPAPQLADDGVDMPIDLDLGDLDVPPVPPASTVAPASSSAPDATPEDGGLTWHALDSSPAPLEAAAPAAAEPSEPTLDFDMPDLDLSSATEPAALGQGNPQPEPEPADASMIEFDLGSLSLDLDQSMPAAGAQASSASGDSDDPMETKLALAQEFHAIGDAEGARTLVEEVIAHASGPLKAKAQRFLAELN